MIHFYVAIPASEECRDRSTGLQGAAQRYVLDHRNFVHWNRERGVPAEVGEKDCLAGLIRIEAGFINIADDQRYYVRLLLRGCMIQTDPCAENRQCGKR